MPEHGHDDDQTEQKGIVPMARATATIRPQTAMGPGFVATARADVATAA